MKLHAVVLPLLLGLATSAIAAPPVTEPATAALHGDAQRPAEAGGWLRSELYFGVGEETGPSRREQTDVISQAQWRAFLDKEVTPRFPDGLTVFDAYGQWLFRGAAEPNRLSTKVLVILHEDTPQRRNDIEAIRLAWKQATHHQSVLWARQPVEVSF
ncbi:DUF3574 domain-containing protein [Stenotrophomonas sp. STM01]|uniref:DUF3574 domain-containing protein n=1 Tax=Stenotrophomonas sp. STM01 TaxID=2769278 RepID=UPI0017807CFD|nr:DUF3574 domain-containing protein [Stenotrophomonas sp. STM01]MBD9536379.1 DUF3574 domain-containing protein [Stenotrophomonas sp. STM01]